MGVVVGAARDIAILLAFCGGLADPAGADTLPRRVALVNAAADQEAGHAAAREIRAALESRGELAPLGPGELARALERPLSPETPEARTAARAGELYVEGARLVYLENKQARLTLHRAEEILAAAPPSPEIVGLLANVNFHLGLVHLEEQNRGLALTAFAAVRRLDPDREELDPGRFKPNVVQAFREAGELATAPASARVRLSATYDGVALFVNGKRAGVAPAELELAPGVHYVAAVSNEYRPSGVRLDLAARESATLSLPLERKSPEERARDIRRRLLDEPERQGALAAKVATLTETSAVILLESGAGGALEASLFADGERRLGGVSPAGDGLEEMLAYLAPPAEELVPPGARFPVEPSREEARPWYQTPLGITGLVGSGLILSVASAALLSWSSRSQNGTRVFTGIDTGAGP